jgi:glucosamine 6-phosphate synthetase-like amidotransferase/phosphosugar isomerase protein
MLHEREVITRGFIERYGQKKPKRIFLFGSGSSFHAAYIVQPLMEKLLGVEVNVAVPGHLSEIVNDCNDSLFFALSQGGKSSTTVTKLGELHAAGVPVISITEANDTLIAGASDLSVPLRIGHEIIGAKTKGVIATVLTLILIALEWSRSWGAADAGFSTKLVTDLDLASRQMPENIRRSLAWFERNKHTMLEAEYMVILGTGCDYGVALEFALKLLETIYRPVIAYEFEEYLHGCQNMLSEKSTVIFLMPNDEARRKQFFDLYHFCRRIGVKVYLISRDKTDDEDTTLTLETTSNEYLGFLEILLPGQILSAHLSAFGGIDVSKSKFPDFSKIMALHAV